MWGEKRTEICVRAICEGVEVTFCPRLEVVQLIIQTTQNQTGCEWASANTVLIPQHTELTFPQSDYIYWPRTRPLDYLNVTALTYVFLSPYHCSLFSSILAAAATAVGAWREEAQHIVQRRLGQKSRDWSHMSGGECMSWRVAESRRNVKDFSKDNSVWVRVFYLQLRTDRIKTSDKHKETEINWGYWA